MCVCELWNEALKEPKHFKDQDVLAGINMRKLILWIDLEYLMGPLEFVLLLVDFLHLFGCNVPK